MDTRDWTLRFKQMSVARLAVYVGLAVGTLLLGILIIFGVHRLRAEPHIRHRSPLLSVCLVVVTMIMLGYAQSRLVFFDQGILGCFIDYAVAAIAMPLWELLVAFRIIRLILLSADSEVRWLSASASTGSAADGLGSGSGSAGVTGGAAVSAAGVAMTLLRERSTGRESGIDQLADEELRVAMALNDSPALPGTTRAQKTQSFGRLGVPVGRQAGRPLSAASACALKARYRSDDRSPLSSPLCCSSMGGCLGGARECGPGSPRIARLWNAPSPGLGSDATLFGPALSRTNSASPARGCTGIGQTAHPGIFSHRYYIHLVHRYRCYATPSWCVIYCTTTVAVQSILVLLLWQYGSQVSLSENDVCFSSWHFQVIAVLPNLIYLLLQPYATWCLCRTRNVFDTRWEMVAVAVIGLVLLLLTSILLSMPGLPLKVRTDALILLSIYYLLVVVVTVAVPLLRTVHERARSSRDVSESAFLAILQNPSQLELLKEFAVMDFSVENVLFYHRCARVQRRAQPFVASGHPLPAYIREDLARIYATFVRQNAGYQVQLDSYTRTDIEEKFARGTADANVFDEAQDEVMQLMYRQTFPRFLRWRSQRRRNWYHYYISPTQRRQQQHSTATWQPLPAHSYA